MTEQELIARLRKGDEDAFRFLVENNRARLYRTVYNLIPDPVETEDTVQETFIQAMESVKSFRGESLISTWMYRIAVRKALEKIRRKKLVRQVRSLLPSWIPQEKHSVNARDNHPGIALEKQEQATALYQALDTLPPSQRMAFQLILVDGLPYAEACELLGVGVKAAESLLSRAKENLRKKLLIYRNR